ncbi:hypothetical protein FHK02_5781 [Spirosoma sp. LMG 31448]|uniref:Uncharacterized protein n=1 Tax=Spirosoma utsteinense TaxID=2585773 RepID=A0ABR6WFY5_9BACT|nr:hypothetical protein [Spirosoma utsteinense]MBC3794951.1 hypothetical protein [Spirosoma utsteinense]
MLERFLRLSESVVTYYGCPSNNICATVKRLIQRHFTMLTVVQTLFNLNKKERNKINASSLHLELNLIYICNKVAYRQV